MTVCSGWARRCIAVPAAWDVVDNSTYCTGRLNAHKDPALASVIVAPGGADLHISYSVAIHPSRWST